MSYKHFTIFECTTHTEILSNLGYSEREFVNQLNVIIQPFVVD